MERRIEDPGEEGSRRRRRSRQAEESVRAVEDEVMGSVRSGDFFFSRESFSCRRRRADLALLRGQGFSHPVGLARPE